jgi:hypothetical protein
MPSICSTTRSRRSTDCCRRLPCCRTGAFYRLVTALALEEALAENGLSGDQDLLLKRLRKLKSELDTMDWRDQRAWKGCSARSTISTRPARQRRPGVRTSWLTNGRVFGKF